MMLDRWWEPVHITSLSAMARCEAAYRYECTIPEDRESAAYRIGRAFHALCTGRDHLVKLYLGRRDKRNAEYREFLEGSAGSIVLSESEASVAYPLAQAVRDNEHARALLDRCTHFEEPLTGKLGGFPVEATPDCWSDDGLVLDLKSAVNGAIEAFQRRGARYGYLAQIDWYAELLRQTTGREYSERYVISADKKYPIPECVTVHRVTPEASEQGRKCWSLWLNKLRVCVDSGIWPGYAIGPVDWMPDPELVEASEEGESWEAEGGEG